VLQLRGQAALRRRRKPRLVSELVEVLVSELVEVLASVLVEVLPLLARQVQRQEGRVAARRVPEGERRRHQASSAFQRRGRRRRVRLVERRRVRS
jgi:hypothetical protein